MKDMIEKNVLDEDFKKETYNSKINEDESKKSTNFSFKKRVTKLKAKIR
jgi:hypothetical protein